MLITDAKAIKSPDFARSPRATSPIGGVGLAYERKLKKALETIHGYDVVYQPWFCYNDRLLCSPDFILVPNEEISNLPLIIIECKLKYINDGVLKLHNLYLPVVRAAFKLRQDPIGILICKHLTIEVRKTIKRLSEAQNNSTNILQWLIHSELEL